MNLVYDVATDAHAAASALWFGLIAAAASAVWAGWLKWRGAKLHAGVKFVGVMALVMFAVSAGSLWEQRVLMRADTLMAEGPVQGYWTQRQRRAGERNAYYLWEGFSVSGVAFAYARDLEQNYFHNAGALALRDGMRVRIRYIKDGERNHILRFETE